MSRYKTRLVNKDSRNTDGDVNEEIGNTTNAPENITLADIYKLISKVDGTVSTLSTKFDCLDNRTTKLENENKKLKEDITNLNARLSSAEYSINQSQQKQFEKYITISNIPVVEQENLFEIVINAINLLRIEISKTNILQCKRIGSKSKNIPLIIVEFDSLELKDTVLDIAKRSGPILSSQIYPEGASSNPDRENNRKIFINQYMTTYTQQLLQEAKKLREKYNIEYIWQNRGIILIRLTQKSKIYKIKSFEDLDRFIDTQLINNN